MKKAGRSEEFALTQKQLTTLWHKCHDLIDKVLVGLCGFCGLRVGEATHLTLDWIRQQEIHVPRSMPCDCSDCMRRKKGTGVWTPKTTAGAREVPITPEFFKPVLNEFLKYRPQGLKMGRIAAYNRIVKLGKRAGIPIKVFPHSLRATYITICGENGMDAAQIAVLVGHGDIQAIASYLKIIRVRPIAKERVKQIFG